VAEPLNEILRGLPQKKKRKKFEIEKSEKVRIQIKRKKFVWSVDCERAFQELKDLLCAHPILSRPDFDKPFIISTDASGFGIAAVLCQRDEVGEHVIAYASRSLTSDERKWPSQHHECLAILYGCSTFRHFVLGKRFTMETDCISLKWIFTATKPSRIVRWALYLAEYDMDIVHRAGEANANADGLSRADHLENDHTFEVSRVDIGRPEDIFDISKNEIRFELVLFYMAVD